MGRFLAVLESVVREGMESGEFAAGDAMAAALTLKQATMTWHHPVMVAECLRIGSTAEAMLADLERTMALLAAGLKRGVR